MSDSYFDLLKSCYRANIILADSFDSSARFAYESMWSPWNAKQRRAGLVRRRRNALRKRDECLARAAQYLAAIQNEESRNA